MSGGLLVLTFWSLTVEINAEITSDVNVLIIHLTINVLSLAIETGLRKRDN